MDHSLQATKLPQQVRRGLDTNPPRAADVIRIVAYHGLEIGVLLRADAQLIFYIHGVAINAAFSPITQDRDLLRKELEEIAVMDRYFHADHIFYVFGDPVVVTGDLLAEAIGKLSERKRNIILLSYFLGLTDREISEHYHVARQSVSSQRARILKELHHLLLKEGFDWSNL